MELKIRQKDPERVWSDFQEQEKLTDEQIEKFKIYEAMLSDWNRTINLTAIRGLSEIVHRHFSDSIAVRNFVDLSKVKLLIDVGSGAGFPGLPLKILYPELDVILMEVQNKRQKFLHAIIQTLELKDIEICTLDWRTFLRTTECPGKQSGEIYFVTRATLPPAELCRMFKPGCSYKNEKLVYWASDEWIPDETVAPFVLKEFEYVLKRKKRKLVMMGLP